MSSEAMRYHIFHGRDKAACVTGVDSAEAAVRLLGAKWKDAYVYAAYSLVVVFCLAGCASAPADSAHPLPADVAPLPVTTLPPEDSGHTVPAVVEPPPAAPIAAPDVNPKPPVGEGAPPVSAPAIVPPAPPPPGVADLKKKKPPIIPNCDRPGT